MQAAKFRDNNEASIVEETGALLSELLVSATKGDDERLRDKLRFMVRLAVQERFCLYLAEPSTPLGLKMEEANKRSRAFGWI